MSVSSIGSNSEEELNPNTIKTALGLSKDFTGLARSLESTSHMMRGTKPDSTGLGSGFRIADPVIGIVTQSLTAHVVTNEAIKAEKIGDVAGLQFAQIGQTKASIGITSVAVQGTLRGLSIAAIYSASTTLLVGMKYLSNIGTALGSAIYTLTVISCSMSMHNQMCFRNLLKKEVKEKNHMQFLFNQIQLSNEERNAVLEKCVREEGVSLTKIEENRLTSEDLAFIESANEEIRDTLKRDLARKIEVKEKDFSRNCGSATLFLLKDNLANGAISSDIQEKILSSALEENQGKIIMNAVVTVASLIGLAGLIVATIFTAGAPLFAAIGAMIFSDLIFFGLDLYAFANEIDSLKAAPKDRILLLAVSLISIMSVAVGSFMAVGPMAKLIVILVGIVFTLIQAGILGWSWYNYEAAKEAKA